VNVISVDPGITSTGIFVYRNGGGFSVCVRKPEGTVKYDHLAAIYRAVLFHARGGGRTGEMDLALVEDYAYSKKASITAASIEAGGIVRAALAEAGVPIVVIAIPTWKSLTIGHMPKDTRGQQHAYCKAVLDKYGHGFVTVDEADAYLIYRATLRCWTEDVGTDAARRIRAEIGAAKEVSAARSRVKG
jgi:hypothetical protein